MIRTHCGDFYFRVIGFVLLMCPFSLRNMISALIERGNGFMHFNNVTRKALLNSFERYVQDIRILGTAQDPVLSHLSLQFWHEVYQSVMGHNNRNKDKDF